MKTLKLSADIGVTVDPQHFIVWEDQRQNQDSDNLFLHLKNLNIARIQEVIIFTDGCLGQNKNSIIPTMLLHLEILKGSSYYILWPIIVKVQETLLTAPLAPASQLIPIFRLARKKYPYFVYTLQHSDFKDSKKMASDLRVHSIRHDD